MVVDDNETSPHNINFLTLLYFQQLTTPASTGVFKLPLNCSLYTFHQLPVQLLTLDERFQTDVFPDWHMHDSPSRELQSEQVSVVVHLSLRHQHTIPIEESCKTGNSNVVSYVSFFLSEHTACRKRVERCERAAQAHLWCCWNPPRSFWRTNVLWDSRGWPRLAHFPWAPLRMLTWIFPTEKAVWTVDDNNLPT